MATLFAKLFNLSLLFAAISLVRGAPAIAEIDCTIIACCELTEEELTACADISEKCPGYSGIGALGPEGECDACPAGECRVGNSCLCPQDFLSNKTGGEFQKLCTEQYGKSWPKSIGKENQVCESEEEEDATAIAEDEETKEEGEEIAQVLEEESQEAEAELEEEETPQKHKSKFSMGMSNVVQYIRKESQNGSNIIGMLSTGVLVISIIAACCCFWTRRRT